MSVLTGNPGVVPSARAAGSAVERAWGGGGYRPWLDGLRVVAVYLVVAFHSGWGWFRGGFVGVDVFFVLSGFLVTRLLTRDLVGSGRVGLGRFYSRRFRRLLPAAFVVLVISAVVFSSLASPVEVAEAEGGFRAAFLYWTNWYFIGQSSDYFGADLATSPVLQFWSLAVEEQFYLVWPLLLGALWALGGRFGANRVRAVQVAVLVGGLASLAWAWSLRSDDPVRAYYGTDARAYQLLAGAFLALTPGVVARAGRFVRTGRVAAVGALVGLGVVASSWVGLDPIERGTAATVVTVVVLVALEAASGGPARAVLSAEPVVYLGKISYGTYLWHWPVLWVMARTLEVSTAATVALTVGIATALASLSFQLLEHPVRISGFLDRHRRPVIAAGLAISIISGLFIIPAINDRATTDTAAANSPQLTTTGFTPVPDLDWRAIKADVPDIVSCADEPASACTLVEGTGAHVLLIGDSHAAMYIPTMVAIAQQHDLTLSVSVHGGCPWQRDLYRIPNSPLGLPQPIERCKAFKDDSYDRVVPALDPDVIVAANADFPARGVPFALPDGTPLETGSTELRERLGDTTRRSLAELEAGDRQVVVIEPVPVSPVGAPDPVTCLSTADTVEACRYVVDPAPSDIDEAYRRLADADDRAWSLDLDRSVCPFLPICDPIVDGRVVQVDAHHLSSATARALVPTITAYLQDNGILPR